MGLLVASGRPHRARGQPALKTLDDLLAEGVAGRHVLVRADLNVPLADVAEGGGTLPPTAAGGGHEQRTITDDGRIRASLPTVERLARAGARVVVCSHLGRPKGVDPAKSLRPVAARLGELLGTGVTFADDTVGPSAQAAAAGLADGGVALLENLRFEPGETAKDEAEVAAMASRLAALVPGGAYVDDAFGAVHRAHASVAGVPRLLPHYAGGLVLAELQVLRRLTESPAPAYVVILGGSKVSDKLGVIRALLPRVDRLVVGGGMCFTFLAAQGLEVGTSLLEEDMVDTCKGLLADAGDRLVLPTDVVVADRFAADADVATVAVDAIPGDRMGLDIGPESAARFAAAVADAKTVFWNGPMGVFELGPFAAGTRVVAEAVAGIGTRDPDALTVVGGGDSAAAVRALGIDESAFGHISTGGGASLEYLEGKALPGLVALDS